MVDGQYGKLLKCFGIKVEEALRKAQLAEDIFSHKTPTMTTSEYFRFMDAVGSLIKDPELPIKIASMDEIESFSPPIFAAYCSKNGMTCIERLARYKRLIGPMQFIISEDNENVIIEMTTDNQEDVIPWFLIEAEMVFLINIIRKATKEEISPVVIKMQTPVKEEVFHQYCKCKVEQFEQNMIVYRKNDLDIPFISQNDSMWDYFEPELKRRLSELEVEDAFSARVRSALTEVLPGGCSTIEDVALKLGVSKRTLQRKLQEENTNFQKQLNHTRKLLALNYMKHTTLTNNDIAYLLGYQELNSFLRAFSIWTGMSVSKYRKEQDIS